MEFKWPNLTEGDALDVGCGKGDEIQNVQYVVQCISLVN